MKRIRNEKEKKKRNDKSQIRIAAHFAVEYDKFFAHQTFSYQF